MNDVSPKAHLLSDIPKERLKLLSGSATDTPNVGDIVQLDQGYTDEQDQAMVLAYTLKNTQRASWQLEVYESEIGPDIE